MLAFSSLIILRESLENFWINNWIIMFLPLAVTDAILSIRRIWTTFGVYFAHNVTQSSSQLSAH